MWWTLLGSALASATALIIALWIFPWQKTLDRKNTILQERRAAYRNYLFITSEIADRLRLLSRRDTASEEADREILDVLDRFHINLRKSSDDMTLVSSDAVLDLLDDHLGALISVLRGLSDSSSVS